jgi:TRAP-type C4-dicarboxylate transport system permease large subunit
MDHAVLREKQSADGPFCEAIRPFYGVMLFVLMLVTYPPEISLWPPHMVLR